MFQSLASLLFLCLAQSADNNPESNPGYNVLFVVIDDLRTEIGGAYGQNDLIYTPNLEAMMDSGFTFTHAYTQFSICGATRASFLTGLRPDTTRVWGIGPYFRNTMINGTGKTIRTLPQYFKDYAKYYTVGAGKVFHPGSSSGGTGSCNLGDDAPYSWSEPYWDCGQGGWAAVSSTATHNCANGTGCVQSQECIDCLTQSGCFKPKNDTDKNDKGNAVCPFDCSGDCVNDGLVSAQIVKKLKQVSMSEKKEPFFIGVGFKRPHLPFDAPTNYYNMYPAQNMKIATHNKPPYNMPIQATNNLSESKNYNDVFDSLEHMKYEWENKEYTISLINDSYQRNMVSVYYSSVSFMDEEFGKVIEAVREYGFWNNTIITVTGDHGWHLGEQGCWTKHTNFEVGVRVPLIVRIPGVNEGKHSDVLVEQLDLFPTIIDASNVGFDANITKQLEGKSLVDIVKNPLKPPNFPQLAYSQYNRGNGKNSTSDNPNITVMGLSMRTTQWRYTEWLGWNVGSTTDKPFPVWDTIYGIELYNHSNVTTDENDMNGYDNYNLAYNDSMKSIVKDLHNTLYSTWDNQSWAMNYDLK